MGWGLVRRVGGHVRHVAQRALGVAQAQRRGRPGLARRAVAAMSTPLYWALPLASRIEIDDTIRRYVGGKPHEHEGWREKMAAVWHQDRGAAIVAAALAAPSVR